MGCRCVILEDMWFIWLVLGFFEMIVFYDVILIWMLYLEFDFNIFGMGRNFNEFFVIIYFLCSFVVINKIIYNYFRNLIFFGYIFNMYFLWFI